MAYSTYRRPGVYTRTIWDPRSVNISGVGMIAALIGEGKESFTAEDVDIVRGSSAYIDIPVIEDLSSKADGLTDTFQLSYYPLVDGSGRHLVVDNVNIIDVTLNGNPVIPTQIDAVKGTFILPVIPEEGSDLKVSYYYARTDVQIENEDLSSQADGTAVDFYTYNRPITDGSGTGAPTTNTKYVTVMVDGSSVPIQSVDGEYGKITLVSPPSNGATVLVTYYTNRWRNTYDLLPNSNVTKAIRCGNVPLQTLYVEGTDFVIVDDKIYWGHAFRIEPYVHTAGATEFSENKISMSLYNRPMVMDEVATIADSAVKTYILKYVPVNSESKPTYDPAHVKVYVGADPQAAYEAGEVVVSKVDPNTRTITLAPSVTLTVGEKIYASYRTIDIADEEYEFKVYNPATGTFKVSALRAGMGVPLVSFKEDGGAGVDWDVADANFTSPSASLRFPYGFRFLKASISDAVDEEVTVTFTSATEFTVTSDNADGSSGTGQLDVPYIDSKTGLTFTILSTDPALHATTGKAADGVDLSEMIQVTYAANDFFKFKVETDAEYVASGASDVYTSIPGVTFSVSDLDGIPVDDSALVSTFNQEGQEPEVSSIYNITYEYDKVSTDFDPILYTKIEDVVYAYGPISPANPLSLAAHMAFSNGAAAIICVQVPKATNSNWGSIEGYKEAIDKLKKPLEGGINPDILVPLRYDDTIIEYLQTHVDIMSSDRYRMERVAYVGFNDGTPPERAREVAQDFHNVRISFVYPDRWVMPLEDDLGNERETLVAGPIAAAAYAGVQTSPAYDAATPMTNKPVVGFSRWGRKLDPTEMDQLAASGITVLEDTDPVVRVRHALTSNTNGVLEREQNIIHIVHYTQKRARKVLNKFIGVKFLHTVLTDIEAAMSSFLQGLIDAEILQNYRNLEATVDSADPTQANVTVEILPVFALNYIKVTFSLRTRF